MNVFTRKPIGRRVERWYSPRCGSFRSALLVHCPLSRKEATADTRYLPHWSGVRRCVNTERTPDHI